MCDEAGANFKGMEEVFGIETVAHKVKTRQWHFLHQLSLKSKVTNEYEGVVMILGHKLCQVTSSGLQTYNGQTI